MNLTSMEAKVREATNNEPWGASTTLMSQIAAGTYNYREREEIMGMIFRRFTEKAANEWRQIYKSLQLLEYLIKNGSERVIDDARANVSIIQILRSFHYVDSKGRDQGINVRNRVKNLVALLDDDSMIRAERKKARNNAKKFGAISSVGYSGGGISSSTTYPGLDDDLSARVFGDGGVYGERYNDTAAEYMNGNGGSSESLEDVRPARSARPTVGSSNVQASSDTGKASQKSKGTDSNALQDLVNLDEGNSNNQNQAQPEEEDDFDDFHVAPSGGTKSNLVGNLSNLYGNQNVSNLYGNPVGQPLGTARTSQITPQQLLLGSQTTNSDSGFSQPKPQPSTPNLSKQQPSGGGDAFSSLFSSAKTKTKTGSSTVSDTRKDSLSNNADAFADFASNTPASLNANSSASNAVTNPSNNNANNGDSKGRDNEVDLLSF